jgi:ribosomal protein S12 methylthiotransferase
VNTCGFIESAVQESLDAIGEAMAENGKVIVTGCLGVHPDKIRAQYPNVLSITGPQQYESVMKAVQDVLPPVEHPFLNLVPPQGIKLTPKHYAYLKISEGCNHACTFCIIPSMRGKLVSRPIDDVLREAQRLAQAGVKELLVISQDTSAYGLDLRYEERTFAGKTWKSKFYDLVKALGEFGIWVRLHYVYPYPHVDDVVELMAEGKVLPYLDIPFQHASPKILRAMKRPGNVEHVLERIGKWRSICPDLTIRSTFITGFPGETEDDFHQLLDFIEEAQLDRVGCFAYSAIEGAAANQLPDPVPEDVKEARREAFMSVQEEISTQKLAAKVGSLQTVLVDQVHEDHLLARSKADAPEIDGWVIVDPHPGVKPGQFLEVEIVDSDAHDLFAEVRPA